MHTADPFAVISREAPRFSEDTVVDLVSDAWGLDVTVKPLVSERDQNFRLRTGDGRRFVLKIANAAEDTEVTDFQIKALLHIAARVRAAQMPVRVPEVVVTRDGADHVILHQDGARHVVRIVTFIAGTPLAERLPSPALAAHMGIFLAHLGRALQGFTHPGSRHGLLWDVQRALELRVLLQHVADDAARSLVATVLDDVERHAMPVLGHLRSQVIHSDLNPDNVIVDPLDDDRVAGVIDFGDMVAAPLIADVAVGACYLRVAEGDPLRLAASFVAGYHGVMPLTKDEIDVLFDLIQARLCASIVILAWRASLRGPDDPYLDKLSAGELPAATYLSRLREIPRQNAVRFFREVCASAGYRHAFS